MYKYNALKKKWSFSFQALKFRLEVSSSDLVFDTDVSVCP
jgi:hypothetical protein